MTIQDEAGGIDPFDIQRRIREQFRLQQELRGYSLTAKLVALLLDVEQYLAATLSLREEHGSAIREACRLLEALLKDQPIRIPGTAAAIRAAGYTAEAQAFITRYFPGEKASK